MITAVDTNVLLDVFLNDRVFGAPSAERLRTCLAEGTLVACDIVWTETASAFPEAGDFLKAMHTLGVHYSEVKTEAAMLAATAWRTYREAGGKRTRLAADFLIGAHAKVQCDRLLTRDRGVYRSYFPGLALVV